MTLVYECDAGAEVDLQRYQAMSKLQKAEAMLTNSTNESIVMDIRTRVDPLFRADSSDDPNDALAREKQAVLCHLFSSRCVESLDVCHELVKASSLSMKAALRLVHDPADLVEIFLACVYSCSSP